MKQRSDTPARTFSPDEANALLPLVRPIAGEWRRLSREIAFRRELFETLPQVEDEDDDESPYDDERAASRVAVDATARRVDELRGELQRIGVVPQDAFAGHLLFPFADREAGEFLSWLPGDDRASNVVDGLEGPERRRPLHRAGDRGALTSPSPLRPSEENN